MRSLLLTTGLIAVAGSAQAHVTEMPQVLHALQHWWPMFAGLPLLALLLPLRGRHR